MNMMTFKRQGYIYTIVGVLIIFYLILLLLSQRQIPSEVFVRQILNNTKIQNIDSVFSKYHEITWLYKKNILKNTKPSEYFGDSFVDFRENIEFVGFRKGLFPKKYHRYKLEGKPDKYLDLLVINAKNYRRVRFVFKKMNTWVLYDIIFE